MRARCARSKRKRGRHALVQRRRAQAAADDQQAQRARASGEARLGRRRRCDDRIAQRIADPFDTCAMRGRGARRESRAGCDRRRTRARGWRVPRPRSASWSTSGLPRRDAHQRAWKRREAAESEHDVGRAAADDAAGSASTRRSSANGPSSKRCAALCRARRETTRLERRRRAAGRASLRCLRACRARTRAQPRASSLRGYRESRKHVAARCRRS